MPWFFMFALMLATGIFAGILIAIITAFAFSPDWPVAVLMIAFLPFGYWAAHRPWQGKRKKGEFRSFLRTLFGPPVTPDGRAVAVGALIGFGLFLPRFAGPLWGSH